MRQLFAMWIAGLTALHSPILARAGGDYPRPDLLVEPAALAKAEEAKSYVILDAREKKKYAAGHVPNARWVDHAAWAETFRNGDDATGWSKRISSLGINADTKVLVYDDNRSKDAARVWWILRYWGVKDVRLLNGGWVGWERDKLPVENTEPAVTPTTFRAAAAPERMATKDELIKSLTGGKLQIVDARSEGEFCGVDAMKNKRAGAMPGAKQLEWLDLLDKDTRTGSNLRTS